MKRTWKGRSSARQPIKIAVTTIVILTLRQIFEVEYIWYRLREALSCKCDWTRLGCVKQHYRTSQYTTDDPSLWRRCSDRDFMLFCTASITQWYSVGFTQHLSETGLDLLGKSTFWISRYNKHISSWRGRLEQSACDMMLKTAYPIWLLNFYLLKTWKNDRYS